MRSAPQRVPPSPSRFALNSIAARPAPIRARVEKHTERRAAQTASISLSVLPLWSFHAVSPCTNFVKFFGRMTGHSPQPLRIAMNQKNLDRRARHAWPPSPATHGANPTRSREPCSIVWTSRPFPESCCQLLWRHSRPPGVPSRAPSRYKPNRPLALAA